MFKKFYLRPRWRKVISDLIENKTRTFLVVASIAIGVFAVGMVIGAYVIIANDMNTSYADSNPANIQLITDPFDKDFPQVIEHIVGVGQVEGRQSVNVRAKISEKDWRGLTLNALPDFNNPQIARLLLVSGTLLPPDHQVVLERHAAQKLGVGVGDVIEIELPDGTRKQLPVAGVALDRTMGYKAFSSVYDGYVTFNTLEWLHFPLTYNHLYITVKQKPNDTIYIKEVTDRITKQLNRSGREVYRTEIFQRNHHPLDSIIRAILGVLLILGILVLFLSGSLIANTLSALLTQQTRQIGVMKLVGGRSSQIIQMYVFLILSFGFISLIFAIPAASWASVSLANMAANLLNVVLQPHAFIPIAVLFQIAVALLVPLLTGIAPVLSGVRVSVQQAINSNGIESGPVKRDFVDRILHTIRGLSRPMLLSLRNTFRRKRRLTLTLFNLTLGGAIFISVFNVQVALNEKIDQTVKYFRADVNLDLDQSYRVDKVTATAMQIPGVQSVEGWLITSGEMKTPDDTTEYATIMSLPAQSNLVTPILIKGRWLLPEDENAITLNEAFLEKFPGLKMGDKINVKINGEKHDWVVVGIFQYTGMNSLFAYTNYPYTSRLLNQPDKASSFRIVTTDHSSATQDSVREQVDHLFKQQGYKMSKVEAGNSLTGNVISYINILVIFLLIMAVLTALVGSIGLTGTLSMNVMERTREIGVMRAIGAYDRIVMRLVIVEGLVISVISYIFGVVLSFPITHLLSNVVSNAIFNSPAKFAFTFQGLLIWFGLVFTLSIVASVIPARTASKMTIREVLAYE